MQIPVFLKAQNPGYTRKDGTYVPPFNDRRPAAPFVKQKSASSKADAWPAHAGSGSLFKKQEPKVPVWARPHPRLDEHGKVKMIHNPTSPSSAATWESPADVAVFTPAGPAPASLNGVAVAPWADHPAGDDWDFVDGQNDDLIEPKLKLGGGKEAASGVIIMEPDGRVWLISPTNAFGSTMHTFPKGKRDEGLSLQANAIKEAWEESGLKVEIDAFALDVERTTSVARYYLARRVGGTPVDMGWESQAVRLVPVDQLHDFLNRPEDRVISDWLRARAVTSAA